MKRFWCIMMLLGVAVFATGCGNTEDAASRQTNTQSSVEDVLQAGMEKADNLSQKQLNEAVQEAQTASLPEVSEETVETEEAEKGINSTEGIDVDLTVLSSTMVYSEVYNMMDNPKEYIGKTVKMNGNFAVYHDGDKNYYSCIIQDATACCAQGMEFVLKGDYTYPDDYPQPGDEITVEGVFDTYMENDYEYCTLREAIFLQ